MDAAVINQSTDLAALAPGLRRQGRYFIGPCPFCGGDDRFNIKRTEAGDLWICRKCGDGRYHDAVAFLMRREGRSFGEVVGGRGRDSVVSGQWSVDSGQSSSVVRGPSSAGGRPSSARGKIDLGHVQEPPDEAWQLMALPRLREAADTLRDADDFFANEAWHYLRAYRGLSPETIGRYLLGFSRDWLRAGSEPLMAPGIFIPCMVDGQLWYAKSRIATSIRRTKQMGKYMALPGSRCAALFNADALLTAHTAVVVEGEFDAMLLGQFLPEGWAAVTMGSAGVLPGAAFLGYFAAVDRVRLRLDNDAAGATGLAAWRALLGRAELLPPLPDGIKDVTAFWRAGGDVGGWVES